MAERGKGWGQEGLGKGWDKGHGLRGGKGSGIYI